MKLILNNTDGCTTFKAALGELSEGAETLSLAVSYLQVGGWELFRNCTPGISLQKMRMVCTDQLRITQPAAVQLAIKSGVQIRNFVGDIVYHPKVFLAHDRKGKPTKALIRILIAHAKIGAIFHSLRFFQRVLVAAPFPVQPPRQGIAV